MEKAIYGLAADFAHPIVKSNRSGTEFSIIEPRTVQYFENVALSLNHVPKETITTTVGKENGELILVQKGWRLFFKFIPSTKEGERIYRYVKQRRYRQCSYTFTVDKCYLDYETQRKMMLFIDKNDTVNRTNARVFEICLTNNPADEETFCTTDANHPMFEGVTWNTNVEFSSKSAGDPWGIKLLSEDIDYRFNKFDKDVEKLLTRFK